MTTGLLVAVLFATDQLYRVLHPEVNFVRATLVGITAWVMLRVLAELGLRSVPAWRGGLAIFVSAFGSVAAIQAGWLESRSTTSAVVHVALLAIAVPILSRIAPADQRLRAASTARTSASGTSSGDSPSRVADA